MHYGTVQYNTGMSHTFSVNVFPDQSGVQDSFTLRVSDVGHSANH